MESDTPHRLNRTIVADRATAAKCRDDLASLNSLFRLRVNVLKYPQNVKFRLIRNVCCVPLDCIFRKLRKRRRDPENVLGERFREPFIWLQSLADRNSCPGLPKTGGSPAKPFEDPAESQYTSDNRMPTLAARDGELTVRRPIERTKFTSSPQACCCLLLNPMLLHHCCPFQR